MDLLEELALVPVREVVDREPRHHEVVAARKLLARKVHHAKLEPRLLPGETPARDAQHLHGEVHERDAGPREPPGDLGAQQPRPRPEVEHLYGLVHPERHGLEHGRVEPLQAGHEQAAGLVVAAGRLVEESPDGHAPPPARVAVMFSRT